MLAPTTTPVASFNTRLPRLPSHQRCRSATERSTPLHNHRETAMLREINTTPLNSVPPPIRTPSHRLYVA
ncbi:hypothetical protein D3C81_1835980 [compost metagenome]